MENTGLLFIPDISGFTQFINKTEIEHSRLVIQELLEILINANQIGLEISEIEGDAILFYKFGETPRLEELYKQIEKMFCSFHRHLISYEFRRLCQCKACSSAIGLTLKVITHYGEFSGYNVKSFNKLIGKDIIVAHQLLKNDIDQHEYWLITKKLLPDIHPMDFANWMQWNSSAKQTESGEIPFHYAQLSPLKNEITSEPLPVLDLSGKTKMISVSREYETDIVTLIRTAADFNLRSLWQVGVKTVEAVDRFLPRVGMKCRCVMENGHAIIYISSYSYNPEKIEFSETDEKRKNTTYYTLEKTGNNKIRLTLDFHIKKNIAAEIIFKLMRKKKMEETIRKSLQNLDELVKEIKLPVQAW